MVAPAHCVRWLVERTVRNGHHVLSLSLVRVALRPQPGSR